MAGNKIVLGIISIIAVFALLTVVYMATNSSSNTSSTFPDTAKVLSDDHLNWSKDKKHILTEYSDLQCPACALFHQYLKGNIDNDPSITKNITFVYRHFPLSIHKHSLEAAYAAEA